MRTVGLLAASALAIATIVFIEVAYMDARADERPEPAAVIKTHQIEPLEEISFEDRIAKASAEHRANLEALVAAEKLREQKILDLMAAVIKLQPGYSSNKQQARTLARVIDTAAMEYGQDSWIALSVARRESSLLSGQVGSAGELGHFQVMPFGAARRQCSEGCDLEELGCNARTAMCWMSKVRQWCRSDDPWVYVAAYGMKRCPSPREARQMATVRVARNFLCEVDPNCNQRWPN